MYRKMFEESFSDIAPKSTDKEFIDKVLKTTEEKNTRRFPKKTLVIPIAIAATTAITMTASAAGDFGLLERIRSYLSIGHGGDFEATGISESGRKFELDDYVVTINGLVTDSSYIYVSYDITYKDSKYFNNDGNVLQKFLDNSPVNLLGDFESHTWSQGKVVSAVGNTVSYVQTFAGEYEDRFDSNSGVFRFDFKCVCFSETSIYQKMDNFLESFDFSEYVSPAKERSVVIDKEVVFSDGQTAILKGALLGPLSARFIFDDVSTSNDFCYDDMVFGMRMKDGTFISLTEKSSAFIRENFLAYYSDTGSDTGENENGWSSVATAAPIYEDDYLVVEGQTGDVLSYDFDSLVSGVLQIGCGTIIDPYNIEAIEINGVSYTLE